MKMVIPVLGILIRRIHIFLDLLDPDPVVRGMDPDPNPSGLSSKNSEKNLDSFCFVTDFLSLKNDVSVPSKSNKQFRVGVLRLKSKITGSASGSCAG